MDVSMAAASFASGAGYATADAAIDRLTGRKRNQYERDNVGNNPAKYAGGASIGDYVVGTKTLWRKGSWRKKAAKLRTDFYRQFVWYFGRLSKFVTPVDSATLSSSCDIGPIRAFQLKNYTNTTESVREYPIHLYELTTKRTETADPTGATQAARNGNGRILAHYLKDSNAAPGVTWGVLTGKSSIGTDAQVLQPWSDNSIGPSSDGYERSVLDKVVVDITMQSCRNQPCTFYIKLVQFDEVGLEPQAPPNSARDAVFRTMAHRLITHPAAIVPPLPKAPANNDMKVLKQWSYSFNPSSNTERMYVGCLRKERIIINLNRVCNYVGDLNNAEDPYAPLSVATVDDYNRAPDYNIANDDNHMFIPDIRARVYLMVSATNITELRHASEPSFDPDNQTATLAGTNLLNNPGYVLNTPQYDLRMYFHHTVVETA